jgi:hypothetical protein
MDKKTVRTVRQDLTILTSLALVGLVGLALLTGVWMDDAGEEFLPLDDLHELVGYAMVLVAGLHVLLRLPSTWTYAKKRVRQLGGGSAGPPQACAGADAAATDAVRHPSLRSE